MHRISPPHQHREAAGPPSGSPGFSLVELLVVLAILLIVLFMGREGYLRERNRERMLACARQLAGQYVALQTYATDHDGAFPYVTNAATSDIPLSLLIPTYTTQTGFWICPGSGDRSLQPARPFTGRTISYAYYMGTRRDDPPGTLLASDEQVDVLPKIEQQLVFSADGRHPGGNHGALGGNFLRTDGSQGTSPARASEPFPIPDHVTLLNPKR